ncbi:hypothetical protein V501_01140 [Pseudogymnoascus sp. VKM F-4519 (FW-2642)]|nr:hypothetical protein V501_01140 [Pseudogymnoascus sp. VKM F-4519 (FW-2642)]
MKLTSPLTFAFALIAQSHACVHFVGSIELNPLPTLSGMNAEVTDNGVVVCSGPTYTDQDGHFSLRCNPGFVFAATKNSALAWYQNSGGQSWEVNLHATRSTKCCGGERPNGGCAITCTDYDWDTYLFC